MDTVDATMNEINTQRELANEISDAISNPAFAGLEVDEVFVHSSINISPLSCYLCIPIELPSPQDELKAELAELEQEDLNERLMGADHVPVHQPAGATRISESTFSSVPNIFFSFRTPRIHLDQNYLHTSMY